MHDNESVNATIEPTERMLEQTGVKALFGGGIGFYPGAPHPRGTSGEDAGKGTGGVDAAGGGYVGRAKPKACIHISHDGGAEYKALVDPVRLVLRGVVLSAGTAGILLGIIKAIRG